MEYNVIPVNIFKGDQFKPNFIKIAPNNRMPVIVDHDVEGKPVVVYESGAILFYLAEKTEKLLPRDKRKKLKSCSGYFGKPVIKAPPQVN